MSSAEWRRPQKQLMLYLRGRRKQRPYKFWIYWTLSEIPQLNIWILRLFRFSRLFVYLTDDYFSESQTASVLNNRLR